MRTPLRIAAGCALLLVSRPHASPATPADGPVPPAGAERIRAVDRLLREARALVDKDVYAAYVEAAARCKEVLALDEPASLAGHALLAYVDALRAYEHGDDVAAEAEAHVEQALRALAAVPTEAAATAARLRAAGDVRGADLVLAASRNAGRSAFLAAARALLAMLRGDAAEATRLVESALEDGGAPARRPLLLATLGAIHLRGGDLDRARKALEEAHGRSPTDVRVIWLLAEQLRLRGPSRAADALSLYDEVLRLEDRHPGALLGRASALLDLHRARDAARDADAVLAGDSGASPRQRAVAEAIRARATKVAR